MKGRRFIIDLHLGANNFSHSNGCVYHLAPALKSLGLQMHVRRWY
jgi:hypothetical protein